MTSGISRQNKGGTMKVGRNNTTLSGPGDDEPRSRRLRQLRWALIVAAITSIALMARAYGLIASAMGVALVIAGLLILMIVWTRWSARRRQRRWRRDGILFEPELPRPISSIPEEYEWQLPAHPLIRAPLAIALMALLYWVLVVHSMQLPGGWLVGTLVLALINLWVWSEPLLLVFIVALGVVVLAIVGWVVNTLPLMGIIAVVLSLVAGLIIILMEVRKRQSKDSSSE
jgi:hypothetical protein